MRAGLPYLREVWRGGGWTLYEVAGRPQVADGAEVVRAGAAELDLRTAGPGEVLVRVQWSRWLTLSGPGCLEPAGRWTRVRAAGPGLLRVGSALQLRQGDRC